MVGSQKNMKQKDLSYLKNWFADYVADFYTENPIDNSTIRLKEKHTEHVCQNMVVLGNALGLSDQDVMLGETMGLFHDVGRFKQYAMYGTFKDADSENHAVIGLRELSAHNILSVCTKDEKKWITKAIYYHNSATIPQNLNGKTLFFIRLLRDADKLDIWRVFIDYYKKREKQPNPVMEMGFPDDPALSPDVVSALNEERFVRIQDVKTLNDYKLLVLSWVFDLNFIPSFQMVKDRKYIDKIGKILPCSKETEAAVKHVHGYLKRNLSSQPCVC